MLKKLVLVGMCIAVLSVATVSFAEDVYITPKGRKYHKAECRLLKDSETEVLDKAVAIEKGYEPCSVCMKDDDPQSSKKLQNKKNKKDK
ncbi:MAG TPA: nuclease [Candidatus Omnitrophota bacterium]|jgi:hypothetical protein|nr:nuclease [Candidatus Omnitrophota bacterium]